MGFAQYARQVEEAVDAFKAALKLQLEKLTEGHPDVAATHEAIGKAYNTLAHMRKNDVQKKRDARKAVDSLETAALMLAAPPCRAEMLQRRVPARSTPKPSE